jgi:hypothetical protein
VYITQIAIVKYPGSFAVYFPTVPSKMECTVKTICCCLTTRLSYFAHVGEELVYNACDVPVTAHQVRGSVA